MASCFRNVHTPWGGGYSETFCIKAGLIFESQHFEFQHLGEGVKKVSIFWGMGIFVDILFGVRF